MAKNTEVVTTDNEYDLPADFMAELAGVSGLGYSEKAEDTLIPILGIIQDNSAELKRKHEKYWEGAVGGDLIIRSLQKKFAGESEDGHGGVLFQPCGFTHNWVEWQGEPGDGVPVNQYDFEHRPDGCREEPDPENPDRIRLVMPNGNRLVDTRNHFGHILDGETLIPVVVPMAGTNHTVSRQWTALMKNKRMPSGRKCHSFFFWYTLKTAFTQRGAQSWYKYSVKEEGPITDEVTLRAGLAMLKSLENHEITPDVASGSESTVNDSPID